MAKNKITGHKGGAGKIEEEDEIISWIIPKYDKHNRGKMWYIATVIFVLFLFIFALFSESSFPNSASKFLFIFLVILSIIVLVINDTREPDKVKFTITDEGLKLGRKFINYNELKDFSIIYQPKSGIKKLYFEFKNVVRPRLSIYLDNINPLKIRDILLNYLPENLERDNEPLSESLSKFLKI